MGENPSPLGVNFSTPLRVDSTISFCEPGDGSNQRENLKKVAQLKSEIGKKVSGCHLWARGYFFASSGNVTDEVIAQYIELQDIAQRARDDDFSIKPC